MLRSATLWSPFPHPRRIIAQIALRDSPVLPVTSSALFFNLKGPQSGHSPAFLSCSRRGHSLTATPYEHFQQFTQYSGGCCILKHRYFASLLQSIIILLGTHYHTCKLLPGSPLQYQHPQGHRLRPPKPRPPPLQLPLPRLPPPPPQQQHPNRQQPPAQPAAPGDRVSLHKP